MSINLDPAFLEQRARANFFFGEKMLFIGDLKSPWIPILQRNFSEVQAHAEFGEIFNLESEQFDFIFIFRSNESVAFLESAYKLLKPSGRIYFSFFSEDWFLKQGFVNTLQKFKDLKQEKAFHAFEFSREPLPLDADVLSYLSREIGFVNFQVSREGGLVCDWLQADSIWVDEGILEIICDKPISSLRRFSSEVFQWISTKTLQWTSYPRHQEDFIRGAEKARDRFYFLMTSQPMIFSNFSTIGYPESVIEKYSSLGATKVDLKSLVAEVCHGLEGELQKFEAILKFVQKSVYRDPLVQPLLKGGRLPPVEGILLAHIGRCGHVSKVLVRLLEEAGLEAQIWQLKNHVTVKCRLNSTWVLADADIFKNGVLTKKNGHYVTVAEIESDPGTLDVFPATGWCYLGDKKGDGGYLGYVENIPFSKRGFASNYFRNNPPIFPSDIVTNLNFSKDEKAGLLTWDIPKEGQDRVLFYKVSISKEKRSWSYRDFGQDGRVGQPLKDVVREEKVEEAFLKISLERGCYYISVTAVTDYVNRCPQAFFWPSEELEIQVL